MTQNGSLSSLLGLILIEPRARVDNHHLISCISLTVTIDMRRLSQRETSKVLATNELHHLHSPPTVIKKSYYKKLILVQPASMTLTLAKSVVHHHDPHMMT